jgi:hypothetical protein
MFLECRHILTRGHKSKAAALRGHAGLYLQGLQRAAQLAVKFDDKPS